MNKSLQPVVSHHATDSQASLKGYSYGFGLSIILTVAAYLLVQHRSFGSHLLVAIVAGLALVQFIVQVVFFLHLGTESKPRWKRMVFLFMLLVVSILVFGSLWIMTNLNYHMQSPSEIKSYMRSEEGL